MKIVAPEEAVGLQLWMAEANTLHNLSRQHDLGI